MKTNFEYRTRPKNQRLADLERKKAELERELLATRESLGRELEREPDAADRYDADADYQPELTLDDEAQWPPEYEDEPMLRFGPEMTVTLDSARSRRNGHAHDRAEQIVHGPSADLGASYGAGPAARNGGRSGHHANGRGRAGHGAAPEPVHDPEPEADCGPGPQPGHGPAPDTGYGPDARPGYGFDPAAGYGAQVPADRDDDAWDDGGRWAGAGGAATGSADGPYPDGYAAAADRDYAAAQPGYGADAWTSYGDDAASERVSGAGHGYDGHPGLGVDGYPGFEPEPGPGEQRPDSGDGEPDGAMTSLLEPARRGDHDAIAPADEGYLVEDRTDVLINHGRPSAHQRRMTRPRKVALVAVVAAVLIAIVVVMVLPGGGASWPRSVAKVQAEIATACQNPDVRSEPGQVNFACGKQTRQILWVFSLLTSGDNPTFADSRTGRVGLEPITPTQGGQVAWSLNLHHPYDPSNPIDSLQVAARAINNIIAGATITGAYGNPIVQAGLEGHAANCVRYTGSPALTSHKGFPRLCAKPISSTAGQAALVADVFQKWVVGAAPVAAQNAAALYANARNPGSPQVQAILKHLPHLSG